MRLLNVVLVAATLLIVGGGYLQERWRLAKIRELPPGQARALYDAGRRRRERTMVLVTAVLIVGALVAFGMRLWGGRS
jgi:hypothetical protein